MGDVLAKVRLGGGRVFVIGEPPLDGIARVVAEDYFNFLPALPLRLDTPRPASVDDEKGPPATVREAGARQAARHFHRGDCLVAFLHEGDDRETRMVLESARAKRVRILIVAGLGAKNSETKRLSKVLLALPTRGIKTVCESCFICARILARVSRAAYRGNREDEERLVQVTCETCNEIVFFEESLRGKKSSCPLCEAKMKIPRSSGRRAASKPSGAGAVAVELTREKVPKRKRKLKPSVMDLPTLTDSELEDSTDADSEPPEPVAEDLPEELEDVDLDELEDEDLEDEDLEGVDLDEDLEGVDLDEDLEDEDLEELEAAVELPEEPSVEAPVGLVSADPSKPPSVEGPSFGSDIIVGSDIVSAVPEGSQRDSQRARVLQTTASADPFSFEDTYLNDLQRPVVGGSSAPSDPEDPTAGPDSRRVSARYTAGECKLRWGRGGYPDDTGPEHSLVQLDRSGLAFVLNPEDEACGTLQKGDELYVRLSIPAFIEPILVRGALQEITGISGNTSGEGARAELLFQEMDPNVRRKIHRASENMGAAAT
jgi:hypothetical protein